MRQLARAASSVLLVLALLAACAGAGPTAAPTPGATDPSTPAPPASPAASPTGPAASPTAQAPSPTVSPAPIDSPRPVSSPSPTASDGGQPSASCINGWHSPPAGSVEREEGLELLALEMGLESELEVVELRYFTGPDVPWIIEPHYPVVERWYVKGRLASDEAFAGRWLLERRSERVRGISGVAPFESTGWQPNDWLGFLGDGPPRAYPDVPGLWPGIPYDVVTGEGDGGMPGLPDEVVGCLEGT